MTDKPTNSEIRKWHDAVEPGRIDWYDIDWHEVSGILLDRLEAIQKEFDAAWKYSGEANVKIKTLETKLEAAEEKAEREFDIATGYWHRWLKIGASLESAEAELSIEIAMRKQAVVDLEAAEAKLSKISGYLNSVMNNAECFAHISKTLQEQTNE